MKILIIRNDNIGDLVLSTPVFREIKKFVPKAEICVITSAINRSMVEKNPNIKRIIVLDTPKLNLKTLLNYLKTAIKIRRMNFDVGIDLRGSLMNSGLLWLSGIKKRVGKCDNHNGNLTDKVISYLLTSPIKTGFHHTDRHITKENLMIINSGLNIKAKNNFPEIITDKEDEIDVEKFLKENKLKEYICICPVARLKLKQWRIENFGEILKFLRKFDIDVLLMGARGDEEELKELAKNNKRCKIVIDFNLRRMLVLFKKSNLVIAQDGGPMHIAGASKTRLIALLPRFIPELGREKFAPLGNNSVVLWADKNMDSINIEDVKKAIEKMLG